MNTCRAAASRHKRAAALASALLLAGAPALAQSLAGTTPGAAAAGGFALGLDVGAISIDVPRLRYGNHFASPGFLGTPSGGRIADFDGRSTRAVPTIGLAWGLPNGLFGGSAEVFGRFGYSQASASASNAAFATGSPSPAGTLGAVPFVAVTSVTGGVITVGSNLLGSSSSGSASLDARRELTTYEGTAGLRLRRRSGAIGFAPGLFVGYVRSHTDDSITATLVDVNSGSARVQNDSRVRGNSYRFGLSLGVDYALAPQWTLFGALEGGLDVVDASLSAGSTISFVSGAAPHFAPASANDQRTRVSGRVGVNAGIAYALAPNLTVSLAGMMNYVGAVPVTRYADQTAIASGTGSNSLYGNVVGTRLVSVGFEQQVNFGGMLGASLKF